MSSPRPEVPALRYALVAVVFSALWASAFVPIKIALRDCPPLWLMASRFLVAGLAMLCWARASGRAFPGSHGEWRRLGWLALLNNVCYLGVNAFTLRHLDAGMGAILASTNPLLLAAVAPWLLAERLTATRGAGLVLSYAGVVWIMRERVGPDNHPLAMGVFLATVPCIVAGTICFKRWRFAADPVVITGAQALLAGLTLLPLALLAEPLADIRPTRALLLSQGYMVAVISVLTMQIWFWLLAHGDATRASSYFFLNPVFGLAMGAAFLAEAVGTRDLLGVAAVAVGIHLVQRSR